ncbi:MAG: hypothetical protein NTX31_03830 [Burkholderiales bacterium]|nr:hypothetical protein [Burkholderiales bacterium]
MATSFNFKMLKDYLAKMMSISSETVVCGLPSEGLSDKQQSEIKNFVTAHGFKVSAFNKHSVVAQKKI